MTRKNLGPGERERSASIRKPDDARDQPSKTPSSGSVETLHKRVGNQAVRSLVENGTIPSPNSPVEKEADRTAEAVVRRPESPKSSKEPTPDHATSLGKRIPEVGTGRPLSESNREYFEQRFGHDFGDVRIHTGPAAIQAARELDARAFTYGRDIAFDSGEYRPTVANGRRLLAHELTHATQDTPASTIHRQERVSNAGTAQGEPASEETTEGPTPAEELGQRLWNRFPAGVVVAYSQSRSDNAEAWRRAQEWAGREQAVGSSAGGVSSLAPENVVFGRAFPDTFGQLSGTLDALHRVLDTAAQSATQPEGLEPQEGTGPSQVRTLGLFAHGTPSLLMLEGSWQGSGFINSLTSSSDALTQDVNVILYACNTGRTPGAAENWRAGTMEAGGGGSLADRTREALANAGLDSATVWAHTTAGHVTRVWALRQFGPTTGGIGESYVRSYVFSVVNEIIAQAEIESELERRGYAVPSENERFQQFIDQRIALSFYNGYRRANQNLEFQGAPLAEMAPLYPLEVADMIEEYWRTNRWPQDKDAIVTAVIGRFNLQRRSSQSGESQGEAGAPSGGTRGETTDED